MPSILSVLVSRMALDVLRYTLAGIVTRTLSRDDDPDTCDPEAFVVFTNVWDYRTWLIDAVGIDVENLIY